MRAQPDHEPARIVLEHPHPLRRDRRADHRGLRRVAAAHHLVQQHPLPQRRRDPVGDLVEPRVGAGKADRHDLRPRPADHLRGKDVPLALDHRAERRVGGGDHAGGKQGDGAALAQMRHRARPHLDGFALPVGIVRERHRDHVGGRHLVEPAQDRARQDLVIRAPPADEIGEDHPVDQPVRMIGHHDQRPLGGDVGDLRLGRAERDAHRVEHRAPERLPGGGAAPLEGAGHAQDADLAGEPLHPADEGRRGGAVERVGVGQAAAVVFFRRGGSPVSPPVSDCALVSTSPVPFR